MLRILTTKFDTTRRCERCDVILSTSHLDTRPVALRISKKLTVKTNHGVRFQCISCAIKFKVSVNEVRKFLHLPLIIEEVKEKHPRIFTSNHVADRCVRGQHEICVNKSETCTCFCHGYYS